MTITKFPEPTICWPWELRDIWCNFVGNVAKECVGCKRYVAADKETRRPLCLYCGMDQGIVLVVDTPFGAVLPDGTVRR